MRGWPTPLSLTNACIDGSRMEIRPDMSAESLYRQTHPYERLWSIIYKAKQISRQIRHCGSVITSHLLYECQHGRRLMGNGRTVPQKFEMHGDGPMGPCLRPPIFGKHYRLDILYQLSLRASLSLHLQQTMCTFHVQR